MQDDAGAVQNDAGAVQDDGGTVAALVLAARAGNQQAWDELVTRFNPLVMAITRGYRLNREDGCDVGQTVWLRLVQHLGALRDPAALPGWIVATTRRECLRVVRQSRRTRTVDPSHTWVFDDAAPAAREQAQPEDGVVGQQRREALLQACAELPERQRELIMLLLRDPPPSYESIAATLRMPIGAIGPTRARALQRLRQSASLVEQSITLPRGDRYAQA